MEKENPTSRMELKVCECCGMLWMRPIGRKWRYCKRCMARVVEIPKADPNLSTNRKRGWRKRKETE